jgi:thiamine kinase-like enzyme
VEPIGEVSGRFSRVLRLRIEAGGHVSNVFVKRYEPRSGTPDETLRFRRYVETEFGRTMLARECATTSAGVARPIACLPDQFAIVTEEAAGIGLDRLFKRMAIFRTPSACEQVERALRCVASWLRHFQAAVPVEKTRVRDYRRYLDIRLQELAANGRGRFGEADRAAALSFFDEHWARVGPDDLTLVPIHGDLCPSNILVGPEGVTVLDLGMSTDGTRYHDLAHVFLHVELAGRRLRLGRPLVNSLNADLLRAFDPSLNAGAPLFRIMLLQHAICYLAQIARQERKPVGAIGEWRARRRVAWSLDVAGLGARSTE